MAVKQNALSELREQTTVDCDTMDVEVAKQLGPFEDCTSNQAIAFNELQKPQHEGLIATSVELAAIQKSETPNVSVEELAVEIAMIKLQLLIVPHITGRVHVQTNPKHSYSTEETVANAKRIVELFQVLEPGFPSERICVKIPSTWEGMQACRILEADGIKTLATTLFSMEQAILAAEVGCTYIAPYVNELKVHFDPTYKDDAKLFDLCLDAQRYYELHGYKTQVLPASLTSIEEVMMLAGVQHITISPPLLLALSQTEFLDESLSIFGQPYSTSQLYGDKVSFVEREGEFRQAFAQSVGGSAAAKLAQAVDIFSDMQAKLEAQFAALVDIASTNAV